MYHLCPYSTGLMAVSLNEKQRNVNGRGIVVRDLAGREIFVISTACRLPVHWCLSRDLRSAVVNAWSCLTIQMCMSGVFLD